MSRQVFVTRQIGEAVLHRLGSHATCVIHPGESGPTRDELIRGLQGKEALLCTVTDPVDEEVIASAPDLRIISNFGVGVNHIDIEAATRRGILVTHTPGVLTDATADLTWALLLDAARRVSEGDRLVRRGGWKGWTPTFMLGTEVTGKTLGIIGMGRIGQEVARRASGFRMRILYHSRRRLAPEKERELRAEYATPDRLLAEADFVSLHAPYTRETHHLIGKRELSLMKPGAILINTARGSLVDEQELVRALKRGQIAAAGLDVYEREPEVHPELPGLEQVVLAPHLGSATRETREAMAHLAVENLKAYFEGRRPPHPVNPEILPS
ncbi:2-hydroxyacid dehydrogenase [Staphylospora marina]|uniref:2-hydroxyacid dehydrogenase n=1 Tax=Staphylospora marina TaxID=2490858 RepID=UPI000F5BC1C2|nr:D-glycerate dehydrogenase [Staphylospora marina]